MKQIKTADDILKPYIERPFRHTEIIEKENAILAMEQFADQFREGINWISIEDQKPEDYTKVLFFDKRDRTVGVGYFVWSQTAVDYVTHWMFLPSEPITK
jgi:hypothetical protein